MKLLRTENAKSFVMAFITVTALCIMFIAIILTTVDAVIGELSLLTIGIDLAAYITLIIIFYYLFDGE